jgi:hypothetical protein
MGFGIFFDLATAIQIPGEVYHVISHGNEHKAT